MYGYREYMTNSEHVSLVNIYARVMDNLSVLCQKWMVRLEELGKMTPGLMIGSTWYWLSK